MSHDVLDMLSKDRVTATQKAEENRALMRTHHPEMMGLIEQLQAHGMFGRVVTMELPVDLSRDADWRERA